MVGSGVTCALSEAMSWLSGKAFLLGYLHCRVAEQIHCDNNTRADGKNFEKQKN